MTDVPVEDPTPGSAWWCGTLFTLEIPAESALCQREECGEPIERLPGTGWLTAADRFPRCKGYGADHPEHDPMASQRGDAAAYEEQQLLIGGGVVDPAEADE